MTLKEKAKKLILDYDFFKAEKEYLTNFEFEIIDFAQYLNEYNLILQEQSKKVYSEKHQLLQKIEYLEKEIEKQHDTIKKLNKNQIDNQLTFAMFKQKFDKTKLNNEHDVMKKLNDLLNENEQLKKEINKLNDKIELIKYLNKEPNKYKVKDNIQVIRLKDYMPEEYYKKMTNEDKMIFMHFINVVLSKLTEIQKENE